MSWLPGAAEHDTNSSDNDIDKQPPSIRFLLPLVESLQSSLFIHRRHLYSQLRLSPGLAVQVLTRPLSGCENSGKGQKHSGLSFIICRMGMIRWSSSQDCRHLEWYLQLSLFLFLQKQEGSVGWDGRWEGASRGRRHTYIYG